MLAVWGKGVVPEGALPWAGREGDAGQSGLQCQHFAVVRIAWSLWLETLPDYPRGGHAAFGEWGSMLPKKYEHFFVFFRYVD